MHLSDKLEEIINKFNFVEAKLNGPLNETDIANYSKQYSELRPVFERTFGVRLEEIVILKDNGPEILSKISRELKVINH